MLAFSQGERRICYNSVGLRKIVCLYIYISYFIAKCLLFLPWCRDNDGVQVFSLSDQRLVVLEITVTNIPSDPLNPEEDGDDAHASQLFITLPDTLPYAGSRVPPQVCLKLRS